MAETLWHATGVYDPEIASITEGDLRGAVRLWLEEGLGAAEIGKRLNGLVAVGVDVWRGRCPLVYPRTLTWHSPEPAKDLAIIPTLRTYGSPEMRHLADLIEFTKASVLSVRESLLLRWPDVQFWPDGRARIDRCGAVNADAAMILKERYARHGFTKDQTNAVAREITRHVALTVGRFEFVIERGVPVPGRGATAPGPVFGLSEEAFALTWKVAEAYMRYEALWASNSSPTRG